MRTSVGLVFLALMSCQRQAVRPNPPEVVRLNVPALSRTDVVLRLFVAGDGGEPGPRHDAVFGAIRKLAVENSGTPGILLMPGDLTYPAGLPSDCVAARERLQRDYLSVVPDVPIVVVPGNHDHGDPDLGTNAVIAARDVYFDCSAQAAAAAIEHWSPDRCPCETRWKDPVGLSGAGSWPLDSRLTLVAYDSQLALSQPDVVAREVERLIAEEPADRRIVVMAHHPLVTFGPHGSEHRSAQDVASAAYQAYVQRFSRLIQAHPDRILLLIFGHEHNLQYLPGMPPALISGAASKTSPVGPVPSGAFGKGDVSGFAVVDLLASGAATVTMIGSGPVHVEGIAPPKISQQP